MKKIILITLLFTLIFSYTYAQRTEINPMIGWRYVFYDTLGLRLNSLQTFEFPADKDYDYRFHIQNIEEDFPCNLTLIVRDLQGTIIYQRQDTLNQPLWITWSEINVPHSTTYEVELILTENLNSKIQRDKTNAIFALIRRMDID